MRKIIILSGASAVGKTYTGRQLALRRPHDIAYASVHTTRPRRPEELTHTDERTFVTEEEFMQMVNQNAFFVYEQFAGNFYGYSHESLNNSDHHVVLDVSPYLLPSFANHSNVIIVGLQPPQPYEAFIKQRMAKRGDSAEDLARRWPFVQRDIADLAKLEEFINRRGRLFQVKDNQTIEQDVLPWLVAQLDVS